IQGDAAGASEALAQGLKKVAEEQEAVLRNQESFITRFVRGATVILNAVTAAVNFYSTTRDNIEIVRDIGEKSRTVADRITRGFDTAREGARKVKQAAEEATASLKKMSGALTFNVSNAASARSFAVSPTPTVAPSFNLLDAQLEKL